MEHNTKTNHVFFGHPIRVLQLTSRKLILEAYGALLIFMRGSGSYSSEYNLPMAACVIKYDDTSDKELTALLISYECLYEHEVHMELDIAKESFPKYSQFSSEGDVYTQTDVDGTPHQWVCLTYVPRAMIKHIFNGLKRDAVRPLRIGCGFYEE